MEETLEYNPLPLVIPWHRVGHSQNIITFNVLRQPELEECLPIHGGSLPGTTAGMETVDMREAPINSTLPTRPLALFKSLLVKYLLLAGGFKHLCIQVGPISNIHGFSVITHAPRHVSISVI